MNALEKMTNRREEKLATFNTKLSKTKVGEYSDIQDNAGHFSNNELFPNCKTINYQFDGGRYNQNERYDVVTQRGNFHVETQLNFPFGTVATRIR